MGDTTANALPFTLRQLECFLAAARLGSISAAASALHASDSAVSEALTTMERTLGAELLVRRRSRGVALTSDGLAVLPIARRLVATADDLVSAVGARPAALTGVVRVGAVPTLAPVLVPRLIDAAAEQLPSVRIELSVGDQSALFAEVDEGEVDVVLAFDIDVPPDLPLTRLLSTHACAVLPADHRLAGRSSLRLDELADEPMVLLDIAPSRVHTLELMSSQGITPRIAYRTEHYELCRSLIGRGLGYSLLMRRIIDPTTWDGGRVATVALDPAPRTVDIVLASKGWQAPRVAAVVELLESLSESLAREADPFTRPGR